MTCTIEADRLAAAREEMRAKGFWRVNAEPILFASLLRLGMRRRPPHYERFRILALDMGVFFGVFWGPVMWLIAWRGEGVSPAEMISSAVVAGAFFGLAMAGWYGLAARCNGLGRWEDLGRATGVAPSSPGGAGRPGGGEGRSE